MHEKIVTSLMNVVRNCTLLKDAQSCHPTNTITQTKFHFLTFLINIVFFYILYFYSLVDFFLGEDAEFLNVHAVFGKKIGQWRLHPGVGSTAVKF